MESSATHTKWLAYVAILPKEDPAACMRVLRTLESLGCAVLREGVYLLPDSADARQSLARLTDHVARINGTAYSLSVTATDELQANTFRSFFDRSRKYEDLIRTVEGLKAGFGISDPSSIARVLHKQRRDYDTIRALDFFPSEPQDRAGRILREIEEQVRSMMFPDAPGSGRVTETGRSYFRRIWATRKPLWADQLASAWLIRRFIDPEATVIWLEKSQECPASSVSFAFDGAKFCNSKTRVTFEELQAYFGLGKNDPLTKIGTLIHCLDAGGAPVAEAAGVETLLQGARRRCAGDDELLFESEKTFDLLYDAYFEPAGSS